MPWPTHEVRNQPPLLAGVNLYQTDAALCGQLRTYRDAVQQALAAQGAAGIATTVIRCAFLSAAGELIELT